jgi:zinc protease
MTTAALSGLAPVRERLPNGAVITAKESRATPAVTIHGAFEAGSVFDPPDQPGLAYFVSRMMDRGTERRSSEEIANELDNRGVTLAININRHVVSVVCTCLTEDFDEMLALVGDVVMHPTFPAAQIATRRSEIVTTIRQDDDNPSAMATEGLLRLLYPGHPYAFRPRGTVPGVEHIPDHALGEFHRARFAPDTLSLVIVGDVDSGRAIAAAGRVFGAWRHVAAAAMALPAVSPATCRQRLVLPMMNKTQADIAYGFATIVRANPDYYAYWLMNNVLGQYSMGGRLGDSIRERQGMAYYVFSALDANVVPGPLMVRAGVNPANVDRAIASIDAELTRLATDGVTDRELAESKQYLVGSLPRTLETNQGIATFLQTAEFFKLGLDYDMRLPGLLEQVTSGDVHAAARATLDPSRAAVVIAGPYSGQGPEGAVQAP